MSRPDVEGIEARASKATAGPWSQCGASDGRCPCGLIWDGAGQTTVAVARAEAGDCDGRPEDVAFIAAARADVPALCAYIHELEAANKALRQPRGCDAGDGMGLTIAERLGS